MNHETTGFSDRLKQAVADDQKWMAQIFMPDAEGNMTNIVPFFDPTALQEIECKMSGFPISSSFQFHGFVGLDDADKLINALKAAAAMSGSRIRASKRKRKSGKKLIQIDLFCNKSKHNSNSLSFNANSIQANHTIIQREHQIASRKGVSRSLTNKLVLDDTLSTVKKVSPVKRSTSIRPLDKQKCCSFGFTIFCSSVNNLWYLSFSPR